MTHDEILKAADKVEKLRRLRKSLERHNELKFSANGYVLPIELENMTQQNYEFITLGDVVKIQGLMATRMKAEIDRLEAELVFPVAVAVPDVTVWHSGPPPHIGWWQASKPRFTDVWRWWDGERWSRGVNQKHSAWQASVAASKPEFWSDNIQWTHYWPENARVPRVAP